MKIVILLAAGAIAYNGAALGARGYQDTHHRAQLPTPVSIEAIDLARIIQGESRYDLKAAYYVGWIAKNRRNHKSFGKTYKEVASGFYGYKKKSQPDIEIIEIATRVLNNRVDPTRGCLFALSHTDIINLGVSPGRANVTYGDWYFFRVWPVESDE